MPPVGFRLTHLYYFDLLIRLLTVLNFPAVSDACSGTFDVHDVNFVGGMQFDFVLKLAKGTNWEDSFELKTIFFKNPLSHKKFKIILAKSLKF